MLLFPLQNFPSFSPQFPPLLSHFPNTSFLPLSMRMSCNGCRVLRKGCGDDCSIKPCLQWIKSPKSQANATQFLAKFYGRTGLVNLINAGPQHLRPAIFRSLLYDACGRIANPVYGSVGLLWARNWDLCQETVEAVLRGAQITRASSSEMAIKGCGIRHVSKDASSSSASDGLHKINSKSKSRFKRSAPKTKPKEEPAALEFVNELGFSRLANGESAVSWGLSQGSDSGGGDRSSVETVEASAADDSGVELELTLGFK